MRKLLAIGLCVVICSCQQKVTVPTSQELIQNPALLAEWQGKCNTGEYSHLAGSEKSDFCSTTQDATISVTEMAAGKKDSDFFKANTLRK